MPKQSGMCEHMHACMPYTYLVPACIFVHLRHRQGLNDDFICSMQRDVVLRPSAHATMQPNAQLLHFKPFTQQSNAT